MKERENTMPPSLYFRNTLMIMAVLGTFLNPLWAQEQPPSYAWGKTLDGWHFYKPNPLEQEIQKTDKSDSVLPTKKSEPMKQESYKDKLEKWQANFLEAKARAIYHPTNANVERVQRMQREIMDRSLNFGTKWMEVSLKTGALTYPEANGNPLYIEAQKSQKNKRTREFFEKARRQNFGFFLITKSGCTFCEQFAPIVKDFSGEYGLEVLEIYVESPTGVFDSKPDNGLVSELNPEGIFPMLFLVDPANKHFHPISRGLSSPTSLLQNIQMVFEELIKEGSLR